MINSLTFGGEKIAGWSIEDMCSFNTDECYVLSFCGCRWEMRSFTEFLQDLPGYNAGTQGQTLSHDPDGNMFRTPGTPQ